MRGYYLYLYCQVAHGLDPLHLALPCHPQEAAEQGRKQGLELAGVYSRRKGYYPGEHDDVDDDKGTSTASPSSSGQGIEASEAWAAPAQEEGNRKGQEEEGGLLYDEELAQAWATLKQRRLALEEVVLAAPTALPPPPSTATPTSPQQQQQQKQQQQQQQQQQKQQQEQALVMQGEPMAATRWGQIREIVWAEDE